MQVSLNIPNQATFDALLPLLQHLNIDFSITEKTVAEPAAAYSVESRRKKLATKLLPKDPNFDWETSAKIILQGASDEFDTDAMISFVNESRQDRKMPIL
jgi:hypothetical protein